MHTYFNQNRSTQYEASQRLIDLESSVLISSSHLQLYGTVPGTQVLCTKCMHALCTNRTQCAQKSHRNILTALSLDYPFKIGI
jgi:hypothetical protein